MTITIQGPIQDTSWGEICTLDAPGISLMIQTPDPIIALQQFGMRHEELRKALKPHTNHAETCNQSHQ